MISFNYENDFEIDNIQILQTWIERVIVSENFELGEINYIFCDDDYLHNLNVEYLDHDTLTDVISFDYTVGNVIQGDIYISTERVADNAQDFKASFSDELHRVMVHGVLHYCGYKDKSEAESEAMRSMENHYLKVLKDIS
ncbi:MULTISPECIES: rRNA maturation RNase YbeY [Bizionia]|uniref:Endoribonuclease YbeY n=1 Tax=Bizionia algoritergicola TaxID=291187 RepID=A0A5D0R1Z7_9FLAO|nr:MULTISPECIES: rRNA maturation RNase YbeY [Bizionia]OBX21667.1 rRNA maturation RNase YbeY [Bizionia sp. APA-3]TYB75099.1 rRNA maturation RNase YbeY [Bizionia algoritergicola]